MKLKPQFVSGSSVAQRAPQPARHWRRGTLDETKNHVGVADGHGVVPAALQPFVQVGPVQLQADGAGAIQQQAAVDAIQAVKVVALVHAEPGEPVPDDGRWAIGLGSILGRLRPHQAGLALAVGEREKQVRIVGGVLDGMAREEDHAEEQVADGQVEGIIVAGAVVVGLLLVLGALVRGRRPDLLTHLLQAPLLRVKRGKGQTQRHYQQAGEYTDHGRAPRRIGVDIAARPRCCNCSWRPPLPPLADAPAHGIKERCLPFVMFRK